VSNLAKANCGVFDRNEYLFTSIYLPKLKCLPDRLQFHFPSCLLFNLKLLQFLHSTCHCETVNRMQRPNEELIRVMCGARIMPPRLTPVSLSALLMGTSEIPGCHPC
jgi:hypothetical protein